MRGLAQAIIGRLHVLTRPEVFVPNKAVEGRIEGIDVANVRFLGNLETGQVIGGIDQQPAQVFANQVNRSAHSGAECGAALTIRSLVRMQPCEGLHRIVLLALDVLGLGVESLGYRSAQQYGIPLRGDPLDTIDVRWSEDVLNSVENRMLGVFCLNDSPSALPFVTTMVAYPSLAHDKRTKCAVAYLSPEGTASREGMCRGTDSDYRLACIEEIRDVLRILRRGATETSARNHKICRLKVLPASNPGLVIRVDVLALRIPGKKNLAVKSVLLRKNLGQHGHALLGPVLFVTRYQNDCLSLARAFLARQVQDLMMSPKEGKNRREKEG